ncbi:MAG: cysteine desulfuration protein SufE [Chthoniobacter sp.]|jgi:cysteine desulfuration protein SufE|nr:cysteine desulfuration protein SufE [Chthoniobacter sp.]
MVMALAEKQQQLIAKYRIIEDPQERLAALTARGRKWPAPSDAERTDANRVQGCVSQVWLVGALEDGRCRFRMAADSPLVQGLAALLCELYDGGTPAEIAAVEPELMEELGIARQLSPTRLDGLANVRRVIREIAGRALAA